jgi:hypothetical protein
MMMSISVDVKLTDDDCFVVAQLRERKPDKDQLNMIMISPGKIGVHTTLYMSREKLEELERDISVFLIETSDEAAGSGG